MSEVRVLAGEPKLALEKSRAFLFVRPILASLEGDSKPASADQREEKRYARQRAGWLRSELRERSSRVLSLASDPREGA